MPVYYHRYVSVRYRYFYLYRTEHGAQHTLSNHARLIDPRYTYSRLVSPFIHSVSGHLLSSSLDTCHSFSPIGTSFDFRSYTRYWHPTVTLCFPCVPSSATSHFLDDWFVSGPRSPASVYPIQSNPGRNARHQAPLFVLLHRALQPCGCGAAGLSS